MGLRKERGYLKLVDIDTTEVEKGPGQKVFAKLIELACSLLPNPRAFHVLAVYRVFSDVQSEAPSLSEVDNNALGAEVKRELEDVDRFKA